MTYRRAMVRRDANESEIVSALRARGAVVVLHSPVRARKGHPEDKGLDLIVAHKGLVTLLEVKVPGQETKRNRRKGASSLDDERAFIEAWRSAGGRAAVISTPEEAIAVACGQEIDPALCHRDPCVCGVPG